MCAQPLVQNGNVWSEQRTTWDSLETIPLIQQGGVAVKAADESSGSRDPVPNPPDAHNAPRSELNDH